MPFTVYRSSAGSGKTFTLVMEYLKLVLKQPENYRHILALTFTNKAANEMKDRVLKYLDLLSGNFTEKEEKRRSDILKILVDETRLDPDIIEKKSKEALLKILHNYSDFSVSTIDSFNHRIIRTFAYDLFLPVNFEVELEQSALISQAVDELLACIGIEEELTKTLVNYSIGQSEQDKSWNIDKGLKDISNLLFKEDARVMISGLNQLSLDDFGRINQKLNKFNSAYEKSIREIGEKGVSLMESNMLTVNDFVQKEKGVGKYFYHLRDFNISKLEPNTYVRNAIDDDKWIPAKSPATVASSFDTIKGRFLELLLEALSLYHRENGRFVFYRAIQANLNQVSVLTELDKILTRLMREQNLVHISEFNRRIAGIVKKEPAPFIYVRLGDKYTSFLVDEFQDTSLLQWQNLLPLINNSLSENNLNLVVGDGKQAIYRWRNGEVEQFSSLPAVFKKPAEPQFSEYEGSLKRSFVEKQLGFNFRTRKNIVDFNNLFFELASKYLSPSLGKIYSNHCQSVPSGQEGGFVRIDFYDKKKDEVETFDDFNARLLLQYVNDCLADGYALSDIAILTRSNKQNAEAASVLIENNIPVQSSDSVLLANSVSIKLLIACLRCLSNPEDVISLALIHRYIRENGFIESHWHDFDRQDSAELSLLELCEHLARYFNLLSGNVPYLLRFFDMVHEYSSKDGNSIPPFLEWWDGQKGNLFLNTPPGLNAIRLMTIHKAKGLEFPVVVFPYANQTISHRNTIWVSAADEYIPELKYALLSTNKSLLETQCAGEYSQEIDKCTLDLLNMVYVAFTRPVDRLYVITSKASEKRSSESITIPYLIDDFISTHPEGMKEGFYECGESIRMEGNKEDNIHNDMVMNELISVDWRNRLFIMENSPEEWSIDKPDDIRQVGILIHDLLSGLKCSSDLGLIMKRLDIAHIPEKISKESIIEKIEKVLNHPLIGKFFDDGLTIFNECSILHPDGSVSRPDRAVLIEGELVIIDYKTGKVSLNHEKQVRYYLQMAREMGYKANKGFLVYLGEKLIVNEIL